MLINKKCIGAFAKKHAFIGMATTPKLVDQDFSVKCELMVMDYFTGETLASIYVEMMFSKLIWCETETNIYLAAVHEKGEIYLYEYTQREIKLITMKKFFKEEIVSIDYLVAKSILVAGSNAGKIGFWVIKELKDVYKLDINITKNISCIACNQKITKILCIGTSNGHIEVIDLKKNKVIMKLGVPNVHEIRKIVWGGENSMKLIVMSEKEYLTEFDLTDNSVKRINEGNGAIIGFNKDIIVYEKSILSNGYIQKINETYDCSLAENSKMILLSHTNGSTEIINVCVVRWHNIIGRRKNMIVMPCKKSDKLMSHLINITKRKISKKAQEDEKFYKGLINLITNVVGKHELGEYILCGAKESERVELNEINKNLIRGQYDEAKNLKLNVDFKFLIAILKNETVCLEKVNEFPVLLILSRIMKNYTALGQLDNAKVVTAILLFDEINDLSSLSFNREARCLQSLLTNSIDKYIINRVDCDSDYLETLELMDSVIKQSYSLLTVPLEDPIIVEYFWYKIFLNEFEDIKNIKFKNQEIEIYLKTLHNEKSVFNYKENLIGSVQKNNNIRESNYTTVVPSYKHIINNFNKASSIQSQNSTSTSFVDSQSSVGFNTGYYNKANILTFPNKSQGDNINTVDNNIKSNSTVSKNFVFNTSQGETNFRNVNQSNISFNNKTYSIPSPELPIKQSTSTMTSQGFKIPSPSMPSHSVLNNSSTSTSFNYQASNNFIPSSLTNTIKNIRTTPVNSTPIFNSERDKIYSLNTGINQPTNMMGSPQSINTGINQPTNMMGSSQSINTGINQPTNMMGSSQFINTGSLKQSNMMGSSQSINTGINQSTNMMGSSQYNNLGSSKQSNTGYSQNITSESTNNSQILHNFENLIVLLKEKASKNHSLIIRARKLQSLNLLESYYNIDKSAIPDSVYKTIDAICTRIKNPDSKLKMDIEMFVVSEIECPWLKAAAELIKMLY